MSATQCHEALRAGAASVVEYRRLRGRFSACIANARWRHGAFRLARESYALALRDNCGMPQVWIKFLFLVAGLGHRGPFPERRHDRTIQRTRNGSS